MSKLPPGRFAFYREELDDLLVTARNFIAGLQQEGQVRFDRNWIKEHHPTLEGAGGNVFEIEFVLAAASYLGLVRIDRESDDWIEVL